MKIHLRKIIFLVVIANGYNVICEESAQYLQNAVRDLRNLNLRQTIRRSDSLFNTNENDENLAQSSTIKIHQRNEKNIVPPPLSLTKGELAALYEAAIAKGETIKLDTGDNSYVNAAIHELDGAETQDINSKKHNYNTETSSSISGNEGDSSGYYYYYYPIKSFLDEMISQSHQSESLYHPSHTEIYHEPTVKPLYQYHSHHHQHNVNITSVNKTALDDKKKTVGGPLFMAISGFIGMAIMFVFSILMFPKFSIKNKHRNDIKKNERINNLARIAIEAIEGGDCTERFACELGKSARNFNIQENRFVKLIRRMAPGTFGKHMDKIGKYSNKRIKCTAIPCKKHNNNNNQKKKNAQNQKKN